LSVMSLTSDDFSVDRIRNLRPKNLPFSFSVAFVNFDLQYSNGSRKE